MVRLYTWGCSAGAVGAGRMLAVLIAIAMFCAAAQPAERLTSYRDEQMKRGRLHDVKLDGYRYCLLDAGSGPALVLLHGLGGSLYDWRHMVDDLAAKHRVIVPDLLGAGESSKPPKGDYSVIAQARRVKGLLDLLGIEKATLVGNSYGGGVAIAFAQNWPERLDGLVLIDTVCYADEIPWYVDLSRVPGAPDLVQVLPERTVERVIRGCYRVPERLTSEEVAVYAEELAPAERRAAAIRTLRALVPDDLTEYHARLRGIQTETLIVWGESDGVIPLKLGKRLADDLPSARLIELPAGHVPNQECPEKIVELIETFRAE